MIKELMGVRVSDLPERKNLMLSKEEQHMEQISLLCQKWQVCYRLSGNVIEDAVELWKKEVQKMVATKK